LPAHVAKNLTDDELTAVFVHELCHLRRHDNLLALFHTLVQALFWFHPLLWFIGAKLLEERERACDQHVLDSGTRPKIYAEGILKVCRSSLESTAVCGCGIAGSDLKKRMEDIMNHHALPKISLIKKVALTLSAAAALLVPVAYGVLHPTSPPPIAARHTSVTLTGADEVLSYESVSIKASASSGGPTMTLLRPDGLTAKGATLRTMILAAYGLQDAQLTGGPEWINSTRYDIDAKAKLPAVAESYKPGEGPKLPGQMMKALLADRFHLVLRQETKNQEVLALVVEKQNPNLRPAKTDDAYADGFHGPDGKPAGPGLFENALPQRITLTGQGIPVGFVTRLASEISKRIVLDKTGLSGKYDFTLTVRGGGTNAAEPMFNFSEEALNDALRQQLGLQLVAKQSGVDLTVIEHAEKAKLD